MHAALMMTKPSGRNGFLICSRHVSCDQVLNLDIKNKPCAFRQSTRAGTVTWLRPSWPREEEGPISRRD